MVILAGGLANVCVPTLNDDDDKVMQHHGHTPADLDWGMQP